MKLKSDILKRLALLIGFGWGENQWENIETETGALQR